MSKHFKAHTARPAKVAPLGSGGAKAKRATHAKLGDGAGSRPAGPAAQETERPKEIGGPSGPEPTRYGDWEIKGRCIDF